MHGVLTHASLARIPADALSLLGRLRAYASVQVRLDGARAWVRWDDAGYEILRALLPVHGAEFYEPVESRWHLCGQSLPAFDVPTTNFISLAAVLTPAAVEPLPDDDEVLPRVVLALRRADQPRPASALLATPKALAAWADTATQVEIAALSAARSGDLVLVTGERLPVISGERYWGERLLCPLGRAPDPDLPESALLEALGVQPNELALVRKGAVEVVPRGALAALARASARLGAG